VGRTGQALELALSAAPLEDLYAQFPSLRDSRHRITSSPTDEYNCVAWVPRELDRWYDPELFWPDDIPKPDGDDDLDCYVALFESWGFERCEDERYEDGFLKIAVYTVGQSFQHVAKQLRDGSWSSKGGVLHDFRHCTLDALQPSGIMVNARPSVFMRHNDDGESQELERTGLILP
jgi:hypothetical protein